IRASSSSSSHSSGSGESAGSVTARSLRRCTAASSRVSSATAREATEPPGRQTEESKPPARIRCPFLRAGERDEPDGVGIAVLGAGPAGLTAAYTLALRGRAAEVFEADGVVGGIAKTVEFAGYRFDLGGHRFFTKLEPIERLWDEMLGDELLTRPRLSRIYYQGKFLAYPLVAKDVVARLGLVESTRCALSYLWSRARPKAEPTSFEDWVTMHFGKRLYDAFFRSYTEKVWGIPGREVKAEWAAQRIKNFSLFKAILTMLGLRRTHVTTLIEEFRYPRLGPGQMWEAFRDRIE